MLNFFGNQKYKLEHRSDNPTRKAKMKKTRGTKCGVECKWTHPFRKTIQRHLLKLPLG